MILWSYFFRTYLKNLFSVIAFILTLYYLISYMERNVRYFSKYKASFKVIFEFFFFEFPYVFCQVLPFSVLISGIITMFIFGRNGEISATQAAGMSIWKISIPFFTVGFLATSLSFSVGEFLLPSSMREYKRISRVKIEGRSLAELFFEGRWIKSENKILHFNDYDEVKQEIIKPEFYVFEDDYTAVSKIAYADKGIFDSLKGVWTLIDGVVTHFSSVETKRLTSESFKSLDTRIEKSPPKIINQDIDSSMLSFRQLYRYMKEAKEAGTNIFDRQVDLHMKLSLPFLNFLFIFLIFPFAFVRERRKETYFGIILALICGFMAWSGNLALRNFAIRGEINPVLAAWLVNILLLFIGLFYLKKLDKTI